MLENYVVGRNTIECSGFESKCFKLGVGFLNSYLMVYKY